MDEYVTREGVVDPEVRAHIYSLVTALGGTGAEEDGTYVLGDDALACLKDIKRWLKLYDEKANRLDVARCLAEANLVKGDLLEILAAWPEDATEDKLRSKIALACLELLVPLTWPMEKNELQTTVNRHRHIPYLEVAQVSYKREILEHRSSEILRKATRVGLPSIALPASERSARDQGIIKLLLYFFRNIAVISAPANLPVEWNEQEVSRSSTIEAFHQQDVFTVLLVIASNIGDEFTAYDVVLLEILFHVLKGVDAGKLFMSETQSTANTSECLHGLMVEEAAFLRTFSKNAPTRHNRFGTMIWVKRDDERVSSVSGQDVLTDKQYTLSKMDQSKKWNRPKQHNKEERTNDHFDLSVPLTTSANAQLRSFVEEFLDAGFNPLFSQLRRAFEREAERVLDMHTGQYSFLISWFLKAECARKKSKKQGNRPGPEVANPTDVDSFGLVASVLNQETFVLLNRFMQKSLDMKSWHELDAEMRCFTQILLTVHEMTESSLEDDHEIAENIQNRIFYEESTHDRILSILRGYKNQGFSYLDASTELSHVFLRMLERYSKENVDLQVRSRRRARKNKKEAINTAHNQDDAADQASEAEELTEAHRVSKERRFDFRRFAARFGTQSCVDSFVKFTSFYRELDHEQLKRAHRFFYRVAFKQERSVMLFRMDIIALLYRIVKGPDALPRVNPMFKEWDELVQQLFRRLIKKMQQRQELAVELLFSKTNSTSFYLEYGYEKASAAKPRAPAELEVRAGMTPDEQIGVAVAVLHENEIDAINWIGIVLDSAISERKAWEAAAIAGRLRSVDDEAPTPQLQEVPQGSPIPIKPDNPERCKAMFKNARLRLLMTLCGFERLGDSENPNAAWIIPASLTSTALSETAASLEKHRENPVMQYGDEDPVAAEDMLRRKATPREPARRAEFDDESDGDGPAGEGEEEFLFPVVGPTDIHRKSALEEIRKKRSRKGGRGEDQVEPDDELLVEARRQARAARELQRRRKIKSEAYVTDSDDGEDDEVFFAKEEGRRRGQAERVGREMTMTIRAGEEGAKGKKARKRKSNAKDERAKTTTFSTDRRTKRLRSSDGDDSTDAMLMSGGPASPSSRSSSSPFPSPRPADDQRRLASSDEDATEGGEDAEETEDEDTPMSSQTEAGLATKRAPPAVAPGPTGWQGPAGEKNITSSAIDFSMADAEDDGDSDVVMESTWQRRRGRAVLGESDDEE